jgi:MFS family permease
MSRDKPLLSALFLPARPACLPMSAIPRLADKVFEKFAVLAGAPRELWLVFAIKLLAYAAYALMNSTLKLWLSSDFGLDDKQALHWVLGWSLSMTVFTLLVGSLTDAIGLRRTFFLGVSACILARAVMVFATTKSVALIGGLLPLAIGEALTTPVLVAAVRRYSNTKQRSISFSLAYALMNVGSILAAFLFDWVRQGYGEYGHMNFFGVQISTYRTLFLVSLFIECSLLPLIYLLRQGAEATDEGLKIVKETPRYQNERFLNAMIWTIRDSAVETVRLLKGLVQQSGFYRLLGFLMFIAFLKLIFMQMYYVFPTFGVRELGEGAPVGKLWAINGILIITLVPFVGAFTQKVSAYRMVVIGGILSAASVFIMALPTNLFEGLANGPFGNFVAHTYLGLKGSVHPYYVMIALFVVVLSFGEAFYSPRVYEYAAAIAPKGQEASYGALSYVPFLLAKVLIGAFSGILLEKYCPETGERHSGMLWLAVALTASIAPVGLIALRRYIRVHEAGRND